MPDQTKESSSPAPDSSKGFSLRHVFSAAIGKAKDAFNSVTSPSLRYGLLSSAPGAFGAMAVVAGADPEIVIGIQLIAGFAGAVGAGGFSGAVGAGAAGAAGVAAVATVVGDAGITAIVAGAAAIAAAADVADGTNDDDLAANGQSQDWGAGIGTFMGATLLAFTIHTHAPDFLGLVKVPTVSIEKQSKAPVPIFAPESRLS